MRSSAEVGSDMVFSHQILMTRFSPIALAQLDMIWDYGFERFGLDQADAYLDGLFDALNVLQSEWQYRGTPPRLVPSDMLSGLTAEPIHFIRYENEVLYFKKMKEGVLGVICILGARMDTPRRLLEMLNHPLSIL